MELGSSVGGSAISRAMWGLAGQGANTAGNVIATFFVAANSTTSDFGAWAVGYACALGILPITRSVSATPMMITSHAHGLETERSAVATGWWVGVMGGVGLVLVSFTLAGPVAESLLVFGIVLPLLTLQDTCRYVFLSRRQPALSARMDTTWLFIQLAGFGGLLVCGAVSGTNATLVWAVSALVSCTWSVRAGAISLSPRQALTYLQRRRWALTRLLLDAVLNGVSTIALPVVLAATSGLSAAAALRAGQTLFGPVSVLVAGLSPIFVVEAVHDLRRGRSRWRLVWIWTGAIGLLGGVYGALILVMPDSVGRYLLGDSWEVAAVIVLPLAVQAVIRGPFTVGPLMLKASHLLTHALSLRLCTSIISVVIPVGAALSWGTLGAGWGIAAAAGINGVLALMWLVFTRKDAIGELDPGGATPV